jgi:hypothetical protein
MTPSKRRKPLAQKDKTQALLTRSPSESDQGQLSIQQCRDILCRDGAVYTNEQLAIIRKVLYTLAELDYRYHTRNKQSSTLIIPIDKNPSSHHDYEQESHPLFPRLYRRAG